MAKNFSATETSQCTEPTGRLLYFMNQSGHMEILTKLCMHYRVFPRSEIGSGGRSCWWLHSMRGFETREFLLSVVFEYGILVHFKIKFNSTYLVKQDFLTIKKVTAKSKCCPDFMQQLMALNVLHHDTHCSG